MLSKPPESVSQRISHRLLRMQMDDGALERAIASASDTLPVSYTHLRAHETVLDLVCRLLLDKKKITKKKKKKQNRKRKHDTG